MITIPYGGYGDNLSKDLNANFTEVALSAQTAQDTADVAEGKANQALLAGIPFMRTVTMTAAQSAAGVVIVPDSVVPTLSKVYVTGFRLNVTGATAWTDSTATLVRIRDNAGSPATGITFAKAALTGNRVIDSLDTTNVTGAAPLLTNAGFTAGYGIKIIGDAVFANGSTISIMVAGYIA
jgi:hypothetical protein